MELRIMQMMKHSYWLIMLSTSLLSCSDIDSSEESYSGELYFKLIFFHPEAFLIEDENGSSLYENFSDLKDTNQLDRNERWLKAYFDVVKEHNLFKQQFFQFKNINSSLDFQTVFLDDPEEFNRIKKFDMNELLANNQKVILELYGKSVSEEIIICSRIKSVKVVKGKTNWSK